MEVLNLRLTCLYTELGHQLKKFQSVKMVIKEPTG